MVRQCSGFTLERYFLRFIPWQQRFHTISQMAKLIDGKVRWRPAPEINKVRFATADEWFAGINRQLAQNTFEISTDSGRVLVGINFEIAEVAALPAKGNV